jgi:hypothetical protein
MSMDPRMRYLVFFFGFCFLAVVVLASTALVLQSGPQLARAVVAEWIVFLVGGVLLFQRLRKTLPAPSIDQKSKAAKSARMMGWLYLGGAGVGLLTNGQKLAPLPHGIGYVIPLIPVALGVYYLRLSAKLKSSSELQQSSAID